VAFEELTILGDMSSIVLHDALLSGGALFHLNRVYSIYFIHSLNQAHLNIFLECDKHHGAYPPDISLALYRSD